MEEKPLVIINGVEGLIGTGLAYIFNENGYKICGLYNEGQGVKDKIRGLEFNKFVNIVSIGDTSNEENCNNISNIINSNGSDSIIYIHALGVYPLELASVKHINKIYTSDDEVEDMIEELSYKSFVSMVNFLSRSNKKVKVVFFGILKDKYYKIKYDKWRDIFDNVKKYIDKMLSSNNNLSFTILNLSSVITENILPVNNMVKIEGEVNEFYLYKQKDFIKEIYYEIYGKQQNSLVEKDIYDRTEENIYYY